MPRPVGGLRKKNGWEDGRVFDRPVGRLAGVRGPKSGQRPPCVFVSAARVMKLSQFHDV